MKPILLGMTRLILNLSNGRRPTGIDRVIIAYLRHYQNHIRGVVQLNLGFQKHNLILSQQANSYILQLIDLRPKYVWFRIIILLLKEGLLKKRYKLSNGFLLNMDFARFDGYPNLSKHPGIICLFMVHDLIPLQYPEYCPPVRPNECRKMVERVVNNAHGVLTNSKATLEELQAFTLSQQQKLPPAHAALLGSDFYFDSTSVSMNRPISEAYFIILGTVEPRKNHLLLLQIWRRLAHQLKEKAPRLLIIGQRGWELENIVDFLERCEILKGLIIEQKVNDNELVNYLYHAQALLFPSFAEGFGIPLVEALSLKVPVIASDLPVFKEIAADIPEYIDCLDSLTWLDMIKAYMDNNNERRLSQLKRLSNYTPPTWKEHFAQVEAFMDVLQ